MDNYIEQALCRALSSNTWDETALEVLSEGYDTGEYEEPGEFVAEFCEDVGVEYDPNLTEPLCSCGGCPWSKRCNIKSEDEDAE
ncbi:Hypothetical protein DPCES_1644 [Desulfitobacterium hafniense]|uniref:Uncharacterized protein n=1 Tax=Desulfitobacterium hafniense TaxID=49338 RepID=A0A098B0Y8_DESHA|nr:hypothetical protein [Desulfitobacterium hafniense]CDX01531.1 Hypothetical protein DPCES_1644 [Desulfitobacterium hafniense]